MNTYMHTHVRTCDRVVAMCITTHLLYFCWRKCDLFTERQDPTTLHITEGERKALFQHHKDTYKERWCGLIGKHDITLYVEGVRKVYTYMHTHVRTCDRVVAMCITTHL